MRKFAVILLGLLWICWLLPETPYWLYDHLIFPAMSAFEWAQENVVVITVIAVIFWLAEAHRRARARRQQQQFDQYQPPHRIQEPRPSHQAPPYLDELQKLLAERNLLPGNGHRHGRNRLSDDDEPPSWPSN